MKRIVKPMTEIPKLVVDNDTVISDISISRLMDQGLVALNREVKNILILSARGKLEASDARDLRDTIKLLFELKDRERELLNGITDEQLEILNNKKTEESKDE